MRRFGGILGSLLVVACGGGAAAGGGAPQPAPSSTQQSPLPSPTSVSSPQSANCMPASTPAPTPTPSGPSPAPATGLGVPSPFTIQVVANLPSPRELSFAPNGDLFVGTEYSKIYIIRNAEDQAATPQVFADVGDQPAAGVTVALQDCSIYVGSQYAVWRIPYTIGDTQAQSAPVKVAAIRTGSAPPGSDGDVHRSTSVATIGNTLYAGVGSSCNACTEIDPTRATIQQMGLDGSHMTTKATRFRNPIALTVNPQTGTLWAGGAGQDKLPTGHPYEFFDPVSLHSGLADYGWPECEENHIAYTPGANCASTIAPRVEFPAYQTIISAVFYPANPSGSYAFPAQYRGGVFVSMHGSWHTPNGCTLPPRVAFVPMNGDTPVTPVDWSDPTKQWTDFVTGFQPGCTNRIGHATGITVGPQGDLFLADDQTGNIYRIRP
ncbi:MAG TPA: hypothetical protein VGZ02_11940 [Candidatus Baltobacteraceae bacterium]|nr:hypothetical protein [Candidatus Baltobacteraceae bacterium]